MKRAFIKLMIVSLVKDKLTYNLPSGVVPDRAMITSIKTRNTGTTHGSRKIEANIDGIILALKRNGTDVDIEIPLESILKQSTNGNCTGYIFPSPCAWNFGETGSELRSYDAGNVTTANVVELEIAFFIE